MTKILFATVATILAFGHLHLRSRTKPPDKRPHQALPRST